MKILLTGLIFVLILCFLKIIKQIQEENKKNKKINKENQVLIPKFITITTTLDIYYLKNKFNNNDFIEKENYYCCNGTYFEITNPYLIKNPYIIKEMYLPEQVKDFHKGRYYEIKTPDVLKKMLDFGFDKSDKKQIQKMIDWCFDKNGNIYHQRIIFVIRA